MQSLKVTGMTCAAMTVAVRFYAVWVLFHSLFPTLPIYDVPLWQAILPGFSWTLLGLLVGLFWMVTYSTVAAVIFTSGYNFFARRNLYLRVS
jgi:uncharacterized membrane protein YkvI